MYINIRQMDFRTKNIPRCHSQQRGWTLEGIMLIDISQTEEDNNHTISVICGI